MRDKLQGIQKTNNKMKQVSVSLPAISLNVSNALNSPVKRHRLAEWIFFFFLIDPTICSLLQTHLRSKDTQKVKVKRWEKIFPCK